MTALLVALGAGVGSLLRSAVDDACRRRWPGFPVGVLTVNLVGSLVLGMVTSLGHDGRALLGIGLCGGFTTYSAFALDTVRLAARGDRARAVVNVVVSVVGCVALCALGRALA